MPRRQLYHLMEREPITGTKPTDREKQYKEMKDTLVTGLQSPGGLEQFKFIFQLHSHSMPCRFFLLPVLLEVDSKSNEILDHCRESHLLLGLFCLHSLLAFSRCDFLLWFPPTVASVMFVLNVSAECLQFHQVSSVQFTHVSLQLPCTLYSFKSSGLP